MNLQENLTACLNRAVQNREAAGYNLLVYQDGKEIAYAEAGCADLAAQTPVTRKSIFRLYSQSKPVTAAAVMILVERGLLDLQTPVDAYLPGFAHPRVLGPQGEEKPLLRAPWIDELLAMTAGLCYPDADPVGRLTARIFENQHCAIREGMALGTVDFCNRLGELPLAFQPGTHWRYSTCADVLGAVVEVVSGKRFGDFLRDELFAPLGMEDTGFWVPPEKQSRLVTCYSRSPQGLRPYHSLHLAVGKYDTPPAFESGGAGLVSTLDDYMAFGQMLLNGGVYRGIRILSEASVRHMTAPQLSAAVRQDMWDNLAGYNYGHLLRICVEPGAAAQLSETGEFGWDGWLGTYFINLPASRVTFLMNQNTTDTGTSAATRKCRNILAARLSR